MKKIITIITYIVISILSCNAVNHDIHLRLFIDDVNNIHFDEAVNELSSIADWTNDSTLPNFDPNRLKLFLLYTPDSIRRLKCYENLIVYIDPNLAISRYMRLGLDYEANYNYKEAEENCYKAYELAQKYCDKRSSIYKEVLYNLSSVCYNHLDYNKAELYLLEYLQFLEQYYPLDKESIGNCYVNLGDVHGRMAKYDLVEIEFSKAKEALSDSAYITSPTLAEIYNKIGLYYNSRYRYTLALNNLLKAETIYLKILNNNVASKYGDTQINIARAYINLGMYDEARKYIEGSENLYKGKYGKNSIQYANVLLAKSDAYKDLGSEKEAEAFALEACSIFRNLLPANHPYIAFSLQRLSGLYSSLGNKELANKYIEQAIQIYKNVCDSSLEYAQLLLNYGAICVQEKNYQMANQLYQDAVNIIKKNESSNPLDVVSALVAISRLYTNAHEQSTQIVNDSLYELAEQYLLYSIYLLDSAQIQLPSLYGTIYNDLGIYHFNNQNYNDALSYYLLALDKQREISSTSIENGLILTHISDTYIRLKNYDTAEKYIREGSQITKNHFYDTWGFMAEKERTLFWEENQYIFTYAIPYLSQLYYPQKHSIADLAYDTELFTKGAILLSTENIKKSIMQSNDTLLIKEWQNLELLRNQLYLMQNRNESSDTIYKYEQDALSLEKEITKKSASYQRNDQLIRTSWKDVRDHLKKNEVAIEFQLAPTFKNHIEGSYNALILRHNSKHPILVPLYTNIESFELFEEIESGKYSYLHNEDKAAQMIWKKILPYIKQNETIYFAPVGNLHYIAIENLPYDSVHAMSDIYNLIRLSSTREIAFHQTADNNDNAVLFGGIEYDLTPDDMSHKATNRSSALFLEGTQHEIDEIHYILSAQHIPVMTFNKADATEQSFNALSGKRNSIIHIATHGFYWSDSIAKQEKFFTRRSLDDDDMTIDPLERCGLLFAGANNTLDGFNPQIFEPSQDGVLTAKEISTMDLKGTDIVILSACETGLGDISLDGINGLQRAFKIAGVNTILMSLWQVDDEATRMLMTSFYRYWKGEKLSKRVAFRKAQNDVRKKYSATQYWAGFIMLD